MFGLPYRYHHDKALVGKQTAFVKAETFQIFNDRWFLQVFYGKC